MDAPESLLEPLFFHRLLKEKVWGGRRLARRLALELPFAGPLGETWELSDYPGQETRVRGGPFDGWSLRRLMSEHGKALLGASRPGREGRFPLLVKLIEAADDLSVQVHPPDGPLAPGGAGKTEAWYVLEAAPGAAVICGLRPGTTAEVFEPDAASAAVQRHLHQLPVAAGDCVFVPAGMTHAIRAGVILCEVQQTSDVTYRLHDWDRPGLDGRPRPTHVKEALQVIDYGLGPGSARQPAFAPEGGAEAALLAECAAFRLRLLRFPAACAYAGAERARVLAVVGGEGRVEGTSGAVRPLAFGDVALMPACAAAVRFEPGPRGLELLEGEAL